VRVHTNWLKSTINAIPQLTNRVYVSLAVNADKSAVKIPYAVIHPADGSDQSDRLAGPAVVAHPRWVVHTVGLTADQAQETAELIKARLIVGGFGVVPVIAGEHPCAVWYSVPQPMDVDTDASPPTIFHTAEIGFESTPI